MAEIFGGINEQIQIYLQLLFNVSFFYLSKKSIK